MKKDGLSFQNIFKRETKVVSYVIICLTIVVISLSYAMFLQVKSNTTNQTVTAGTLTFTYSGDTTISNANNSTCFLPISADEAGLLYSSCEYTFSVQNTGTLASTFTLSLTDNGSTISASKLKVVLKKSNGVSFDTILSDTTISSLASYDLTTISLGVNEIATYSIQIYVDEDQYQDGDENYTINYTVTGTQIVDENTQDLSTTS